MIKLHFFVEICQLCALDLPLFEVSIKAFHEIICVKNGPTLPHSTEDISGTDRATDTIFFALKSEEYFPADKIAINCSSIVLLTPPDLPSKEIDTGRAPPNHATISYLCSLNIMGEITTY